MNLVVGGDWNEVGRPSSIVARLAERLGWKVMNGGRIEDLRNIDLSGVDALVWMPNVSNDEEKILPDIKKRYPKLLLISSKRVVEKEHYTPSDVIGRLLASHSNLGVMITKPADRLSFTLLDPLGNQWASTMEVDELATAISSRVETLLSMRRSGSECIGPRRPFQIDSEFIRIIRDYGNRFTQYVNAVNPNRLLGNASTRCAKGFPSYRTPGAIYVTRRNVDKTTLSEEDFVEIQPATRKVRYYGDQKPSVDAPIQLQLFGFYRNINYMIHGHVYVDGAPFTSHKVPCGAVDEVDEIIAAVPDPATSFFAVNLSGHGCLILAETLQQLEGVKLMGRPFPET